MDGLADGWMVRTWRMKLTKKFWKMDSWMDGLIDGWMDGLMHDRWIKLEDEWVMDGLWMDGKRSGGVDAYQVQNFQHSSFLSLQNF
jgi:hypothetical protein